MTERADPPRHSQHKEDAEMLRTREVRLGEPQLTGDRWWPHETWKFADLLEEGAYLTSYERFIAEPIEEIFLSGGGAKNPALVAAITAQVAPRVVSDFDKTFFDGEAKEAVAFALLGYLHLAGKPGNVPTATGARGPRILGKRTPA